MSKMFSAGLVVGKFCPLHQGHQLLIDTAIEQCREVWVISYTKPEFENCEPENREIWLAELYPLVKRLVIDDDRLREICLLKNIPVCKIPDNNAPEIEHRNFVGWLCYFVLATTVEAVFTSENYGDGFADALSGYFSEQIGIPIAVHHLCVDKPRTNIPISGTAIRLNPESKRSFLAPVVYADIVCRVAILGGESCGKTTLAKLLASHLDTAWVPEFGRELWEQQDGKLQLPDMLKIGQTQIAHERLIGRKARRWLICDTTPMTTAFYSEQMFGCIDPALQQLAKRKYGHIILCAPDFDFVQDGTRQSAEFRNLQHDWYINQFQNLGLAFSIVHGSVSERLEKVYAAIGRDTPENHSSALWEARDSPHSQNINMAAATIKTKPAM
jgi:HTH-type transcriptional regulator, transcriptional repressor of NAD biosynthesis genes